LEIDWQLLSRSRIISTDKDKLAAFGDFFSKIYTIEPDAVRYDTVYLIMQ